MATKARVTSYPAEASTPGWYSYRILLYILFSCPYLCSSALICGFGPSLLSRFTIVAGWLAFCLASGRILEKHRCYGE